MSQHHSQLPKYAGRKRKLVLAFDIGTTYSGISYSVLDPGQVPEVKGVTRFPAHEQISGASKIPTILYYDQEGTMVSAGAEATKEGIYETAMDGDWEKAEWFKLRIRSERGTTIQLENMLPPLPSNKTVIEVLADFMKYLHNCAKEYIQDTHANGRDLWGSVEKDIDYVISHPNGWEGYQQTQMRDAVILAGLVTNTDAGKERIVFLTEGEASLHYAIRNGLPSGVLNNGEGVIIVDAGGGTVDVSAYRKVPGAGKEGFEEIAVPQCHFFGSAFVSIYAKIFLSTLLADSIFIDDLDHIVRRFDMTTKLRFRSDKEVQFVRFGGNRDNDDNCGIRYGQLRIPGKDVASFFAPSVKCIVEAVLGQAKNAHNPISHVVLVGGFASNDWLYSQIEAGLVGHNLTLIRPENHINKAVSEGALAFYLHRQVHTRVSKFAYGELYAKDFDPTNLDHLAHEKNSSYLSLTTGTKRLRGVFDCMIPKNHKIEEKKEYRAAGTYLSSSIDDLKRVSGEVWCYKGNNPKPQWKADEPNMYSRLCLIITDLSHLPRKVISKPGGGVYYQIAYDCVLFYEGVELKAQMAWVENGVDKRSPAHVVYDPTDFAVSPPS